MLHRSAYRGVVQYVHGNVIQSIVKTFVRINQVSIVPKKRMFSQSLRHTDMLNTPTTPRSSGSGRTPQVATWENTRGRWRMTCTFAMWSIPPHDLFFQHKGPMCPEIHSPGTLVSLKVFDAATHVINDVNALNMTCIHTRGCCQVYRPQTLKCMYEIEHRTLDVHNHRLCFMKIIRDRVM